MSKKIVIDPGHGGSDPGTSANGITEKEYTLKISQYMKNSNNVDDFLKFESDQDVWNLVYRITSKKSTPNYIFEYSRIVDILENKTIGTYKKIKYII